MGADYTDGAGMPGGEGPFSYAVEGGQGPVKLRYLAPPGVMRRYFGSLYVFQVDSDGFADMTRADVPQLRFMLRGEGHYLFHTGEQVATPGVCLLGPTMGATRFVLDGPGLVIGLSLLPAGWMTLHGDDASLLADNLCDMVAAHGEDYGDLLEALREIADPDEAAARIWAFMETRLVGIAPATWKLLEIVDQWLTEESSPQVDRLARETGLSARQLARITRRFYGAPPKLLARKYRALRCSARIAIDRESWQALCEDGTFYDQSHFIREIKQFIGLTPHQLLTEPSAVAQLTLLRRSLGGDVAVLNRLS